MQKTIAVFGSGTVEEGAEAWQLAYAVGKLLTEAGFYVMNGGYAGTMLASAKGAKEAGGEPIGVTTDEWGPSKANPFIHEEIRTSTWRERLHELIRMSDGCVVLDGGTGTMTELLVYWEMLNKGLHQKPMVLLGPTLQKWYEAISINPAVKRPELLYVAKHVSQISDIFRKNSNLKSG
jgi:uncharacterized protein (TIGR00725 family)